MGGSARAILPASIRSGPKTLEHLLAQAAVPGAAAAARRDPVPGGRHRQPGTVAACVVSVALGAVLTVMPERGALFLLVPVWLFLRMAFNAIDGMLAREFGQASTLGAYLNELTDVVSDARALSAFRVSAGFEPMLVGAVIVLSIVSEIAGVLGATIGASRRYDGPMGKSDRAFVFGLIGLLVGLGFGPGMVRAFLVDLDASSLALLALTVVNRVRAGLAEARARTNCRMSLLTGASPEPSPRSPGSSPARRRAGSAARRRPVQRIYYGNHSSHADFVLIWASLPPPLRALTRPVAGADYWEKGAVRRFLIHEVLHGVLVDRERRDATVSPVDTIVAALDAGHSLIFFPEGTRNTTDEMLLPFKSGLYHVACRRPDVELVPVWMENLGRVLPKGELVPVPLLCSINFGAPLRIEARRKTRTRFSRARAMRFSTSAPACEHA